MRVRFLPDDVDRVVAFDGITTPPAAAPCFFGPLSPPLPAGDDAVDEVGVPRSVRSVLPPLVLLPLPLLLVFSSNSPSLESASNPAACFGLGEMYGRAKGRRAERWTMFSSAVNSQAEAHANMSTSRWTVLAPPPSR